MFDFEEIEPHDRWHGCQWSILDDDQVARALAFIALGRAEHVENILAATGGMDQTKPKSANAAKSARDLLCVSPGQDPYHRDGWLFQCLSFIAACLQNPHSFKAPPHMIHADKGFDGLQILTSPQNKNLVTKVIITEDKATEHARDHVRDKVWPDFIKTESNERQSALIARTTEVLRANGFQPAGPAVDAIFWDQARAYRVAITISDTHSTAEGRNRLFEGYEGAVEGEDIERRRVETLCLPDFRSYLEALSTKAIALVDTWEADHV